MVRKMLLWGMLGLIVVFGAIQLVPVRLVNPPVTSDIQTSPEVKAVLRRACYDCHSNEVVWPWYSHIAPISWLVAKDVNDGRDELNYSTWDRYSVKKRAKKIRESWETVNEREMPPLVYTLLHPEARLSSEDHQVLRIWAGTAGASALQEDDGRRRRKGRKKDDD